MFKLLVLSCLLVSCLADPFELPSWLREGGRRQRHPQGCANRGEGWRACASQNASDTLAPHGYDCSLFFYCSSAGARPACRKCPAGLHFNPQLQVCDWPDNVDCNSRPPHPPRPRPTGHPSHNGTTYPTTSNGSATVSTTTISSNGNVTNEATTDPSTTETSTPTDASTTPTSTPIDASTTPTSTPT